MTSAWRRIISSKQNDSVPAPWVRLGRSVVSSWQNFFDSFRPDEDEFEQATYHNAGEIIQRRLNENQQNAALDADLCRDIVLALDGFYRQRIGELSERIDELTTAVRSADNTARSERMTRAYQEDELSAAHRLLKKIAIDKGLITEDASDNTDETNQTNSTEKKSVETHNNANEPSLIELLQLLFPDSHTLE